MDFSPSISSDNTKDESSAADVVEVSDGGGVVFRRHSSANYTIETSNDSQMNIRRLKGLKFNFS